MAVYSNSPTLTYVKLTGITITKNDKVYTVRDFKTNLKYIYWDFEVPQQLNAVDVMPSRSQAKYLIMVNNKGEPIIVPNEDITVSFDGNSVDSLSEKVYGLYEKSDEFTNKFISVEQDIDGIRTTVGNHTEELGKVSENISKIDQKADGIDLSVKKLDREYNNNKELLDLRENTNKAIIDLNSTLGIFKSKTNEYFKDSKIVDDEKVEIQLHIEKLNKSRDVVIDQIDKVIALMELQGHQDKMTILNGSKDKLNTDIANLISLINTSISDNTIVPTEITIIINAFAKCNITINDIKNTIDEIIFLGVGGTVSEELARIGVKSDEISLNVSKVEETVDGVDKKYSEIILSPDGIVSKVEKVETNTTEQGKKIDRVSSEVQQLAGEISSKVSAGDVSSIIRQSPNDVKFGFNGISDNVVINSNGLTVNQGSVACDTLTTPPGHDPVINLFTGGDCNCQIDARMTDGGAKGGALRFKYNDWAYLYLNDNGMSLYQVGRQIMDFNGGVDGANIKCFGGMLKLRYDGVYYEDYNTYTTRKLAYVGEGGGSVTWNSITGKPSSFNPSWHSHSSGDISFSNSMTFGDINTGSGSRWSYMGGYIETTGSCNAGSFNTKTAYSARVESMASTMSIQSVDENTSDSGVKMLTGSVDTDVTTTVTPNLEYIGNDNVINGECKVNLPPTVYGAGTTYNIQLTAIGDNPHIYVKEKNKDSFVVKGDDCNFDYIIKVRLPRVPDRLKR